MKVINIFGGPGIGKSTVAADIFVELKKNFFNVELRTEFAKDLIYEQRDSILQCDQLYVLAKQNRKLNMLLDKNLEYVVTDSPILLQMIYNNPENLDQRIFEELVIDLHNRYDNINFLLERNKDYRYNPNGRLSSSVEEAVKYDEKIKERLDYYNIQYNSFKNNEKVTDKIISKIFEERLNNNII